MNEREENDRSLPRLVCKASIETKTRRKKCLESRRKVATTVAGRNGQE